MLTCPISDELLWSDQSDNHTQNWHACILRSLWMLSCLDNLPLKVLQGPIQMAALRPCVPHQWCSARFESPEPFPRAFQIWSISWFSRHPKRRFCAKRVSSQRFPFSGVKMAPGPETYCFRTGTFSEVFLLGVGGVFSVKNVSSERFSLARFWAKRVFSEKGLLVLFPLPWPGSA